LIILDHASPEEEKEDFTEKMAKKGKKRNSWGCEVLESIAEFYL